MDVGHCCKSKVINFLFSLEMLGKSGALLEIWKMCAQKSSDS